MLITNEKGGYIDWKVNKSIEAYKVVYNTLVTLVGCEEFDLAGYGDSTFLKK